MKNREEMILNNLRLVHKVLRDKIIFNYQDYEDLYMYGVEGLIKAVDMFDESKNVCFSTFAYKVIFVEIMKYLNSKQNKEDAISLDTTLFYHDGKDDHLYLISTIKDINDGPEELFLKDEEKAVINKLLRKVKLSDRQRFMILLHYGFYNGRAYTRKELAKMFHVSENYIGLVIRQFLIKMRRLVVVEYGKDGLVNFEKYKLYVQKNRKNV